MKKMLVEASGLIFTEFKKNEFSTKIQFRSSLTHKFGGKLTPS